MENNKKENTNRFVAFLQKNILTNMPIKIVALLFAMVLWGIVLVDEKPIKIKTFHNVPVAVEGEANLYARNLCVRGDINELLKDVTIKVNTPVTSYMDLQMNNISASVSLNAVSTTGTAKLAINASCRLGTIDANKDIDPNIITVEIDTLMTKTVPVDVMRMGVLPDAYHAETPQLSSASVEIRGPKQDIQRVAKAVCKIQMNGRTESFNEAVEVVLLDESGDEIDHSLLVSQVPTVSVFMPVLSKKTVPIDVSGALRGADNLPANFELYGATANPETLTIVGSAQDLSEIESIPLAGIDVSSRTESLHDLEVKYSLPENVQVITGGNEDGTVEVFVDIREKTNAKQMLDVPIEIRGLARGYAATLSQQSTDLQIEGRITLVDPLEWADAKAYVDLTGLKEGVYTINVSVLLENEDVTRELTYTQSLAQVQVTITKE